MERQDFSPGVARHGDVTHRQANQLDRYSAGLVVHDKGSIAREPAHGGPALGDTCSWLAFSSER